MKIGVGRWSPLAAVCLFMAAVRADGGETEQWGTSTILPNLPGDFRYSIVVDAAGFAYVGGSQEVAADSWDFMIAKFDPAGNLVPTFGTGGIVTLDTGGTAPADDELCNDLKLDDAGKIYISGSRRDVTLGGAGVVVVARFNSDGAPDSTFDTDGFAEVASPAFLDEGMAVESGASPRVYLAGSFDNGTDDDGILLRLTSAGALDTTFGSPNGYVTWDNGGNRDVFGGAAVDAAGDVYVNGATDPSFMGGDLPGDTSDAVVRKYDDTGAPVAGFGTAGTVVFDGAAGLGDGTERCIVKGGFLYVAGSTDVGTAMTANHAALVLKLDAATGAPDAAFSLDGAAVSDPGSGVDRLFAVDADAAGFVYAAGVTPNPTNAADEDLLILKFRPDGALDPQFDGDGIYTADSGSLDGGEGIRAGNSFHVVARWGNGVRAMYFKSSARRGGGGGGSCGLLGVEGMLALMLALRVVLGRRRS